MYHREPGATEIVVMQIATTLMKPIYRRYADSIDLAGCRQVLDYGSGTGVLSKYLARQLRKGGGILTCVDVSERWQAKAKRELRRYANVEFRLGRLMALEFDDGHFDAISLHFVLHELDSISRPHITRELARILSPGSQLFIREPISISHGMPAAEIQQLMAECNLIEIFGREYTAPILGQTYAGAYMKRNRKLSE